MTGNTINSNIQSVMKHRKNSINWMPYLFIAPSILLILSFLFYPMANVFYYSLQHFNANKPYYNGFAGLDNFIKIFTNDEIFKLSLWISFKSVI